MPMDVPLGHGYNGEMPNNRIAGLAQQPAASPPPLGIRLALAVLDDVTDAPVKDVRFRVYGRTGGAPVRIGPVSLPAVSRKLADVVGADGTADVAVPVFPGGWRVNLTAPGYRFVFHDVPGPSREDAASGQVGRTLYMKARAAPGRKLPDDLIEDVLPPVRPKEPGFPWIPVVAVGAVIAVAALTSKDSR